MRVKFSLWIAACLIAGPIVRGGDTVDVGGQASWAAFEPGAWVVSEGDMVSLNGRVVRIRKTETLRSFNDTHATIQSRVDAFDAAGKPDGPPSDVALRVSHGESQFDRLPDEAIVLKGQTFHCHVYRIAEEFPSPGEPAGSFRYYVSADVPGGIVRRVHDRPGKPSLVRNLIDYYGVRAAPATRPAATSGPAAAEPPPG